MKKKVFIIIIAILNNSFILFSQIKTDTINCAPFSLTVELLGTYKEQISSYEEGFTKVYSFQDSSYILVNCGSMISLPILYAKIDTILSCSQKSDSVNIIKGINKYQKCFREEDYNQYRIVVLYDNVTNKNLELFNKMLDNIKIEKRNSSRK